MIIYIHGFGGSGEGMKARKFKAHIQRHDAEPFLAPSLSYVPELAMKTLSELIETLQRSSDESLNSIKLIGSSLGGYYALYLAERYNLKAVLLNPSLYPYETLRNSVGDAPNFYDQSRFVWNAEHIASLKQFEVTSPSTPQNILMLLQSGDELLDYRLAMQKLPQVKSVVEEGGSHAFENIEHYFGEIESFFI